MRRADRPGARDALYIGRLKTIGGRPAEIEGIPMSRTRSAYAALFHQVQDAPGRAANSRRPVAGCPVTPDATAISLLTGDSVVDTTDRSERNPLREQRQRMP